MEFLNSEKFNKILLGVIIVLQIITISIVVLCSDCYNSSSDENKKVKEVAVIEDVQMDSIPVESKEIITKIRVDVKGAVKKPGVYELDSNSRVIEAIQLAGGTKSNASTKYLNLSRKITDEMVIYVYTNNQIKNMSIQEDIKEECECPTIDTSSCAGSNVIITDDSVINEDIVSDNKSNDTTVKEESDIQKISLNKASKEELMTLSGVGESKALAIIDYRTKNNGFKTLEDIMNVSGIGEALYNKIKDNITL